MIFEWDDFGANHVISDMCQSHDCRDQLDKLHATNPAFKCTLFAVPGEMTQELLNWCGANSSWVELAVHGFYHSSNYECEKMSYEDFDYHMSVLGDITGGFFVKGFRAPGWQISDDAYRWLKDHDWWVADQGYNDYRRSGDLRAYVNYNGLFKVYNPIPGPRGKEKFLWRGVDTYHGHTWDVGAKGNEPNGIYEDFNKVAELVNKTTDFKFVSELFV